MRCNVCGSETPSSAQFCPQCGASMRSSEATAPGGSSSAVAKLRGGAEAVPDSTEKPLWQGSYSPRAMFGTWILVGFIEAAAAAFAVWLNHRNAWIGFAVVSVLLGGVPALILTYRRLSVRYELTTERLIHARGILKRVTDRIEAIDIDDVTFEQGIVERALGVGSIRIQSSDRTHPELVLPGIESVQSVAEMIDNVRRAERQRRGIHIEAV